ncbi:MAG TPA: hypothetical protein PKM73_03550 [Verrucomicrobiota bacterium]|nr:hypothetical protein [Verrucomicrobiota bacterium]
MVRLPGVVVTPKCLRSSAVRWWRLRRPWPEVAAVDRLVHHATILEFTGESIRAQKAKEKKTA